ncbi:MAG TPA: GtrA family protein, partial [Acidobacteriota bacterium]|nr:GtrA family protein [Acidobacteriota bacterium]
MTSNSTSRLWWLLKQVWQFTRFAVVGALNTGIDFAITNILVLMLQPSSGVVLFLISVVACGVATLNSYVLNRRWTFADAFGPADRAEKLKFAAVAGLSMAINTTSFLFLVRFLPRYLPPELPEWLGVPGFILVVNLAKFGGVLAAFILSFLGFRFGVFKTEAVHTFRKTFAFPAAPDRGGNVQVLAAVGLAATLRLLLVLPGAPLSGDAVVNAAAARDAVAGGWAVVEPAGLNLFTAWQALVLATGMGQVAAAVVASLVPGVLLLLPVVRITRTLYGAPAAWLAALFTAAHPRLMEYSVNGEAFSFYLCAFAAGVWALVRLARGGGLGAGTAVGAAFGLAAAVHNDGFTAFVAALPLTVGLACPSRGLLTPRGGEAGGRWLARLAVGAAAAAAFAAVMIGWVLAMPAAPGDGGLLHVTAAPVRVFTERLDLAEAARAIYGEAATAAQSVAPDRWSGWMAQVARVPQNLLYCLERTPGLLLTP